MPLNTGNPNAVLANRKIRCIYALDVFSAPFELHNHSFEDTYVCFLKWPP